MSRPIQSIRASGLCAGCGLCASFAGEDSVVMEESAQGWLRPRVEGEVSDRVERVIEAACPAINIVDPSIENEGPRDPAWGAISRLAFTWASDPDLRHLGSSGGGLSAMLAHLLETRQVDYVVETAMSEETAIRNQTMRVRDLGGIRASAGSRYAPSAPLENIDALLEGGARFAFVGKPCDVAALRQLGRIDSRVDKSVAWMFAFFCAGVPSYRGTDVLLKEMGVPADAEIESFRYRGEGWPGYAKAVTSDGETYSMDYDTSWGSILNRHLQFRCKICPDGIGEFADISFADGWHCDDSGNPLFDEAEGRSLAIMRNAKAARLFDEAVKAGFLANQPADIAALAGMQRFQFERKGFVPSRLAAFATVGHRPPRFSGLDIKTKARTISVKRHVRSFLGTLRRLLVRRTEA